MGYKEAKQIVKDMKLHNKTKLELLAMVKDEDFHRIEKKYPGYFSKSTLVEMLSAELQN